MAWNNPLITHLLDFLFELKRSGLKMPVTIAGGLGLFLKRQYLHHQNVRTLFDIHGSRSTEDIDIFIRHEVLADVEQSQYIKKALESTNYEVIEQAKFMQWKKAIDLELQPGEIKLDFLVGNIETVQDHLHVKPPRARNRYVKGLHAYITPEAMLIDEQAQEIPLSGQRSNGEHYNTTICIPHPFTYLVMKLFAFRDRINHPNKRKSSHHAFDVFFIIGSITERELDEVIELWAKYAHDPIIQEANQIVRDHFTGISPNGMIAIKSHALFNNFDAEYEEFLKVLMDICAVVR